MNNSIPRDWKQARLKQLILDIAMGPFGSDLKVSMFKSEGVPIIKGENLKNNYVSGEFTFVSEKKADSLGKAIALPGDFIVTHRGSLGQVSLVCDNYKYARYVTSQSQLRFTVDNKKISNRFLLYFFKSSVGQHEIFKNTTRVGVPSIMSPTKAVKSFKISYPILPEQHRIVAVLETWDKALEALSHKIELKKNIKKGLMQELLTGKRRLKGFSGEWQTTKLGDVCDISRGGSPRPIQNYITNENEGLNWLKIGDIEKGARFITKTECKIKREGLKKTTEVNPGDFILSNSMSFGRPYIMKIKACIHDGWLALKNIKDNFNKTYLYYKLSSQEIQNEFSSISAGSGVQNLKKETVSEILIKFPSIEEQTAIAQILTTADDEITALEKKKQILEDQKKFLLNNLITGQIRTPENLTIPTQ